MPPILLPFPTEPDAKYARSIVDTIVPIWEAAQQEAFLGRAQAEGRYPDEPRNPLVARFPDTQTYRDPRTETRAQLALAFYALHGDSGFHCSAEDRRKNPRRFEMEKLLHHDSKFSLFMLDEISRRKTGPEPRLLSGDEKRIRDLFATLGQVFSGTGVKVAALNIPPEAPVESPADRVLREALEYYKYVLKEWDII